NDPVLAVSIAANDVWEFEAFILCTSTSSSPDIKYTFTVPSGATIRWTDNNQPFGSTSITEMGLATASGTVRTMAINGGTSYLIRVRGVVANGSTAGNLQFQWSQDSSNATATQVLAN